MTNEIKEILFLLHNDRLTDSGKRKLEDYINDLQRQLVYCLKYETGAGIRDCKIALEKCNYNYNTAYKYLRLISDGVARWKIVDGQRVKWTDEDYIKCARGNE